MKTSTKENYIKIIELCKDIYLKKSKDYGSAWRILRVTSLTDQIFIKAQRIRSIQEKKVEAKLILQVHDELILDTPKNEIDAVIKLVTNSMMGAADLDVPLDIDVGIGDNWDQAH